jgi:DNA-binding SARP family transcriptional activator/tetratricopeptide (TPR) repeat protein
MDFRILGPLAAYRLEQDVRIGGSRQQTTLAMLLLEPGNVVPLTRLVDAMWDGDPPTTARAQVQICISSLRRAITTDDGAHMIDTRSPGYLLRLEGATLDVQDFEAMVAVGRQAVAAGDLVRAAAEFRGALALWRGPALSNIGSALVQNSVAYLNERRLTILEECLEVELHTGLLQDVAAELAGLTREYPLRERYRVLLMMALYQAGRQAEALAVYRTTREVLMDQLGVEPGQELQRLHQTVLNGDPLPAAATAPPAPPVTLRAPVTVPRLLPAAIPDITGRSEIIGSIVSAVSAVPSSGEPDYAIGVNVLFGQGGAGKTTLAVHIAHRLADQFPDGQLFVRLRVGDHSANPADVLGRFLRALGLDGSSLPEDIEERAEMYRDLLSRRKILVVLDDAASEQQVALLLPGSRTCSVVVTSRKRLLGLPAANRYEVAAFRRTTSVELLSRIAGAPRIEAEPDGADTICRLCGDLPLALRIVAARLAARPHWSIADLVERLVDESHRLDELNHGEMGVRASIKMSYQGLSPDAQRLFRLLAVSEAPNFAPWVGSPLLETSAFHAGDLLEELAEAFLIDTEQSPAAEPVRYRFHDLTRPFAREQLLAEEPAPARRAALERLCGALLYLTREAHCREYSGNYMNSASPASLWELPDVLTDRLLQDPLAWYEQERMSIVMGVRQAAAGGLVEHAWDLAMCAVTLFEAHSYFRDWRETHDIALQAACNSGDRRGEAAMRYSLGSLYMFEQQNKQAEQQFEQATRLYSEIGDEHGAALVLRNSAMVDRRNGNLEQALARSRAALAAFQRVGDRVAEAHVLHNMAQVWLDYGADDTARDLLDRAVEICMETGNRRVYAQVQHQLGELRLRGGDLDWAVEAYTCVLDIVRVSRDRVGECYALVGLAKVDIERGWLEKAQRTLAAALEMAAETGDKLVEGKVALALADAELASGLVSAAADHADRALANCERIGAALLTAQVLTLRGRIHRATGEPGPARAVWDRAAAVLSKMRLRGAVALSAELESLKLGAASEPESSDRSLGPPCLLPGRVVR